MNFRAVRKEINRKEYDNARNTIEKNIDGLSGKHLDQARMMLASVETKTERAVRLYREIISSGRKREAFKARVELAKIYYSLGSYREVLETLGRIPGDSRSEERMEAHYFKGLASKQLGDSEKAEIEFGLVDRGEYLYWGYMALAEIDIQYGRVGAAVERYETIAGSHSNPVAGFKLGECYEILGEQEKAINVYGNLTRLFPESLEAPQAREKLRVLDRITSRKKPIASKGGEREETAVSRIDDAPTSDQLYTLQFGAFSVRENADIFADKLRKTIEGLRVEVSESRGRIWYRVRTGRYPNREKAEADALRFMEQTGYSSKVLPLE
ncbi:MAG: SPOR domain-containing protein [Candidatus Krumholzibacteria bacterium]|nr:SPOR domain-containing protein [Candidatus Krumholzibacteria bacterium]